MKRSFAGGAALTLMLALACTASAVEIGVWNSDEDPLWTGTWMEIYGADGPGKPGCKLSAESKQPPPDSHQWLLDFLYIPVGGGAQSEVNGNIVTYTTDYESDKNLSGGLPATLSLFEAPMLWGAGADFIDVTATVVARLDISNPQNPVYLGGEITGTGTTADMMYTASFYAEVMRTNSQPCFHEGSVDYLELTIVPEPTPFLLGIFTVALMVRRR